MLLVPWVCAQAPIGRSPNLLKTRPLSLDFATIATFFSLLTGLSCLGEQGIVSYIDNHSLTIGFTWKSDQIVHSISESIDEFKEEHWIQLGRLKLNPRICTEITLEMGGTAILEFLDDLILEIETERDRPKPSYHWTPN